MLSNFSRICLGPKIINLVFFLLYSGIFWRSWCCTITCHDHQSPTLSEPAIFYTTKIESCYWAKLPRWDILYCQRWCHGEYYISTTSYHAIRTIYNFALWLYIHKVPHHSRQFNFVRQRPQLFFSIQDVAEGSATNAHSSAHPTRGFHSRRRYVSLFSLFS